MKDVFIEMLDYFLDPASLLCEYSVSECLIRREGTYELFLPLYPFGPLKAESSSIAPIFLRIVELLICPPFSL